MRDAFSFKRTERLPSREMTLKSAATFDLASASSVKFVYRTKGIVERRELAAVVVDAPAKRIRVDFGDTDVAIVGKFEWHIEVVLGGKLMTFPEGGFFTFAVTGNIEA
jgi:hypothetical protein